MCALVFLEHGTRCLYITGVTTHPTQEWTTQQARNLAADLGHRMESLRFLLRDRDGKYSQTFDTVFHADDPRAIKSGRATSSSIERRPLRTGQRHHQARDQLPSGAQRHPTSVPSGTPSAGARTAALAPSRGTPRARATRHGPSVGDPAEQVRGGGVRVVAVEELR
jgi:hypothetical protein